MINREMIEVVKFEERSIVCDMCHKEYTYSDTWDSLKIQEFVSITHYCGYASVFGDGNVLAVDFCDSCFKVMLETMLPGQLDNFIKEE
jgi:formate-dependent nitrite reductase cytochrome c552 subunit